PDAAAAPEPRALVRGFHDSRAGAGDRREARQGEEAPDLHRRQVLRIVRMRSRRAENGDRLPDVRELVESLDELAHDPQHAPRVAPREVVRVGDRLEELLVLGGVRVVLVAYRVVYPALGLRLLRGRCVRVLRICSSWHHSSLLSRVTSREMAHSSVVILVADGVRPDTLAAAMSAGEVPALARPSADGGMHVVTSVFPSLPGPADPPF